MEFKGSGEGTRGPGDGRGGWDETGSGESGAALEGFSEEDEEIFEEVLDLPSDPDELEALFRKYPELRLARSEPEVGEAPEELDEDFFGELRDLPLGSEEEEAQWLASQESLRASSEAQSLGETTDERREGREKGIDLSDARQVSGRFPEDAGPDEILVRRKHDGSVTAYAVYGPDGLPLKRVDLDPNSAPHAGIPAPHVLETVRNTNPKTGVVYIDWEKTPRPARPNELPL